MNKLFEDFKDVTLDEWKDKIISDLKDADFNENLVSEVDDIKINPVYNSESITHNFNCILPSDWISFQEIDATNAEEANKKALIALKNDITGLSFKNTSNLEVLLDGISVNHISVRFTKHTESFLEEWNNYCKSNNKT